MVIESREDSLAPELQRQLDELQRDAVAQRPAAVVATLKQAVEDLVRSGIAERSLKSGDVAPDFELANEVGNVFCLSVALTKGPVVVTFYRGAW
jgi:hypothetical protein